MAQLYTKWKKAEALRQGTPRQRQAYETLTKLQIYERVHPFDPILAGTIPLGIDTEESDLDIICEARNPNLFAESLRTHYGTLSGFRIHETVKQGLPTTVCRFHYKDWPIECFGQPVPVTEQNALIHMDIEHRLLQLAGPEAKQAILRLKTEGWKTEPAFAHYFRIKGDPYEALLLLARCSDDELRAIFEL
ncbi:DUF4269 domain-containing protein [Paenibacillus sp. J2TS4]|uniref:DUF4269 domain-containing protein n=1 Tax=Paenibacillus sp. J2TS4 TaxID=2807194 RepID=UPI001B28D95E|nr:DUF4269 domain-containing protein [Paenibacillus sp. J2TS4]GIP33926.1 alpha/beta hydrolase [Paenibacillus sp. J2TS4]